MNPNIPACKYEKNQLVNVICQLRFPRILAIGTREPAEFQDAVRSEFPLFNVKLESVPPKLVTQDGGVAQLKQEPVKNYGFRTADGSAIINLTDSFVSLSVKSYTTWEAFAASLDKMAAAFCSIYKPAYFERVGLRYINAFSRQELEIPNAKWSDLIEPRYAGLLADLPENDFSKCSQDAELHLHGGFNAKIHCGPGMIKRGGVPDPSPRYVLDFDLFVSGQLLPQHLSVSLLNMHDHASRLFRDAITEELHNALQPKY